MYGREISGAIVSCFVPKVASPSTCVNYWIKSKLGLAAHNLNRPKVPPGLRLSGSMSLSTSMRPSATQLVPFTPMPSFIIAEKGPTVSPSH